MNRVGLGEIVRPEDPVARIVAVAKAALVAKGVQIGDPAAVRVDRGMKAATKAGPAAVRVDDRLKVSPKSN